MVAPQGTRYLIGPALGTRRRDTLRVGHPGGRNDDLDLALSRRLARLFITVFWSVCYRRGGNVEVMKNTTEGGMEGGRQRSAANNQGRGDDGRRAGRDGEVWREAGS
ncbi:hypothetical protein E2C01_009157 [Portunus trituberculatus]|uniref:Uncharacterized protein n=1 Tax=Portunus trituberculatus TaxID=210409 RepID=A0A5B7D4Q6_PORTR|nr:hypothetical protein [Portunus trituberculatus]